MRAILKEHLAELVPETAGEAAELVITSSARPGARHYGPAQSNGMCLLEFVVHWKL